MGIGERIRMAAEARGLSLKSAAKKCDISYSSLQNWVSGIREPRLDALVSIGSHLGVSIDWLLTGNGSMSRDPSVLEASPSTVEGAGITQREQAILELFRALDDGDQRGIQVVIEERRRLQSLERRIDELTAVIADIKRPA